MGKREQTSPATRLIRKKETNAKYELNSRIQRSNIKVTNDLFLRWCRMRDNRGMSNDEFVSHLLAIEETNVNMVEKDIIGDQNPSEEPGYHGYIMKEEGFQTVDDTEVLPARELETEEETIHGEGWTEDRGNVREFCKVTWQGETGHRRYHTDSLQENEFADGPYEDDVVTEDFGAARLHVGDAVDRAYQTDPLQIEIKWTDNDNAKIQPSKDTDYQTFYIKPEPLDNDCTEVGSINQQTYTHSSNQQDEYFSLNQSIQSVTCTQRISCDGPELPTQLESPPSKRGLTQPGEKPYQCAICERSFSEECNMNLHMIRVHAVEKPYRCTICDDKFNHIDNLKMHMSFHKRIMPYQCSVCNKGFPRKVNLTIHERTHTGGEPFQCPICLRIFSQTQLLKKHMKTHAAGERPYGCSICNVRFSHHDSLARHIKTHKGENHQCTVCDKRFPNKVKLKVHMRNHTVNKLYHCSFCDVAFLKASNLKIHERTHTGEKPFQCEICDRSFVRNQTLKDHMRTHTGEKPYRCAECDIRFSLLKSLTRHITTHTSQKRRWCEVCNKGFSHGSTLKLHMRTHTEEKQ